MLKEVPVLLLQMELFLPEVHSLKEKRMILNRIKEKLKKKFNISIVEAYYQDLWQRSVIAIAIVGNSESHLMEQSQKILSEVDRIYPSYVVNYRSEVI